PRPWSSVRTGGLSLRAAVGDDYIYVADHEGGLQIVDVADPGDPWEIARVSTPGGASGVATAGSYIFLADGVCGLRIFDATDPTRPLEVGSYQTPGIITSVAVFKRLALVTSSGVPGLPTACSLWSAAP